MAARAATMVVVVAAVDVVVVLWDVAERLVLVEVGGRHRHGWCATLRLVLAVGVLVLLVLMLVGVRRCLHKGCVAAGAVGSNDLDGTAGAVLG